MFSPIIYFNLLIYNEFLNGTFCMKWPETPTSHTRRGFSAQNLWYMRQFYIAYRQDPILQQLVGEIPWGQNLAILSKVKSREARHYYINAAREMGWTRAVLIHNIQSKSYEQQGLASKQAA